MRERFSELIEFGRWPMQLQTDQIGHLECFGEHCSNIIEMRQDAVGTGITFPAEDFIPVHRESIEKIFLLGRSFLNEGRERSLEELELPRVNFEVRMKRDEIRKRIHRIILQEQTEETEQTS